MDGLSVCANIISVIQLTAETVSLCYDFRAALKQSPWSLTLILDEIRELRTVLEKLERLARDQYTCNTSAKSNCNALELLCNDSVGGPLISSRREIAVLQKLLCAPKLAGRHGSARHALIQALGWRLKDGEVKACLARLERCKSTLTLALTADEAYVAP